MTVPLNYICYQKTDCYTQDSSLFCKIHFLFYFLSFIPLGNPQMSVRDITLTEICSQRIVASLKQFVKFFQSQHDARLTSLVSFKLTLVH